MTGDGMRRNAVLIIVVTLSVFFASATTADDPRNGAELYRKYNCQICHGEQGRGQVRAGYPVIAGQDKSYLIQQITDIRDGTRENGRAKLMRTLVRDIGDDEIESIAAYLSTVH